jgi:GT2 family glycosyltransferase
LLNNDVEVDALWLRELVDALDRLPTAGSVASKMMDFDDRTLISAAGDCVTPSGLHFGRGFRERDVGQYRLLEPVFSACAGAALYRRAAFDAVGLFDEDFFAYLEDVDWGFRAQLRGFTCWYVPTAVAFHIGGATSSKITGLRGPLLIRNALWLTAKDVPSRLALRHALPIAFVHARRIYRAMRDGDKRPVLNAVAQAITGAPRMLKKRREIQACRQTDVPYLNGVLSREVSLGSSKLHRFTRTWGKARLTGAKKQT